MFNSFRIALIISTLVHSAIFLPLPNLKFFPKRLISKSPEINYVKIANLPAPVAKNQVIAKKEKLKASKRKQEIAKKKEALKKKQKPSSVKEKPKPKIKNSFVQVKKEELKKQQAKERKRQKKRQEFQKQIDELNKNTDYQNYYMTIRRLIKKSVRYPSKQVEGDVYVNFTLLRDGQLLSYSVLDEESVDSNLLKKAAMNGLKRASPFPPFPRPLNKKDSLNISVIISFRMFN